MYMKTANIEELSEDSSEDEDTPRDHVQKTNVNNEK